MMTTFNIITTKNEVDGKKDMTDYKKETNTIPS